MGHVRCEWALKNSIMFVTMVLSSRGVEWKVRDDLSFCRRRQI